MLAESKLSLEFTKHMLKDEVRKFFIPTKIYLEILCCWPCGRSLYGKLFSWFLFVNMLMVEIFHTVYVVLNVSDLLNAIGASATVITSFEALVRLHVLLTNQEIIEGILIKMSKQFWPVDTILKPEIRKQLRRKMIVSILLPFIYLACATMSTAGYVLLSLKNNQLLYRSVFPFVWSKIYVYELLYSWQYFTNWCNIFVITAFDVFFVSTIVIFTVQLVILQEVLKFMFSEESSKHRKIIFGKRGEYMTDRVMLSHCLEQHKMLISICNDMEATLQKNTLLQLAVSVNGSCAACLMMAMDFSQVGKMLSFGTAHLLQLFYYCHVCQELSSQSEGLADAIYASNWHLEYNRDFRKTLILMMQRTQQQIKMTAVGLIALDFSTFIRVLRFTFSLYTFMSAVLARNG